MFGTRDSVGDGVRAGDVVGLFVGVAGLAASITVLFLGMRAVMDIGGVCADGGPYVSRQSCPEGVALLMPLGIFGWFGFAGLTALFGGRIGGAYAGLAFLAWPALFLSLGLNFIVYGLNPPWGGGADASWLLCGVVFWVMGAGPLVAILFADRSPTVRRASTVARSAGGIIALGVAGPGPGSRRSGVASAGPGPDLITRLERLSALHRTGDLTDAEFAAAKRSLLEAAERTP